MHEDKKYHCYYLNLLWYYFENKRYYCYHLKLLWYYSDENSINRGWPPKKQRQVLFYAIHTAS